MGSLRFLLAFAVAAGHALGSFNFPNVYLAGGEAVQIFYMISGFLIALILRDKYADSASGNWILNGYQKLVVKKQRSKVKKQNLKVNDQRNLFTIR